MTTMRASMRSEVQAYLAQGLPSAPSQQSAESLAWRLSCFDSGFAYARYIEEDYFSIKGKRLLDLACAWGGHAIAFACEGAQVVASDLNDHHFPSLSSFSRRQGLELWPSRADCERLPFADRTFDVVMGLELVEHIESVDAFAAEVARVLRPGGICIISTPPRLRSLVQGEPHYGIRGLTTLPLPCQRAVATRWFGRGYPYPITRQYTSASKVIRPFASRGLRGFAVLRGRLARCLVGSPWMLWLARELFWSFVVVTKPALPPPSGEEYGYAQTHCDATSEDSGVLRT